MTGLSAVIGSWKIIAMRAQRSARSRAAPAAQQVLALEQHARRRPAGWPGQQPHDRLRGHRLARAGLADEAEDLAAAAPEADPLDRVTPVGALGQRDREARDLEYRPADCYARPSSSMASYPGRRRIRCLPRYPVNNTLKLSSGSKTRLRDTVGFESRLSLAVAATRGRQCRSANSASRLA